MFFLKKVLRISSQVYWNNCQYLTGHYGEKETAICQWTVPGVTTTPAPWYTGTISTTPAAQALYVEGARCTNHGDCNPGLFCGVTCWTGISEREQAVEDVEDVEDHKRTASSNR